MNQDYLLLMYKGGGASGKQTVKGSISLFLLLATAPPSTKLKVKMSISQGGYSACRQSYGDDGQKGLIF